MVGLWYHFARRAKDGNAITERQYFWANLPVSGKVEKSTLEMKWNNTLSLFKQQLKPLFKGIKIKVNRENLCLSCRHAPPTCSLSPVHSCVGWHHLEGSAIRRFFHCLNPPG